jgi:Uma2 family endonuclease
MSTVILPTNKAMADDDLYEVVDGKRVRQAPMAYYAVLLANILFSQLSNFVRATSLGRAVQEALFVLPAPIGRNRRPDVAFVSYQRWAKTRPLSRTADAWDVVPNVAAEVVSPHDDAEELLAKIDEYFRAGVDLVWVVYPQRNQVYVYQSPTQITVLGVNDVLEGGTAIPGFRFALAELFSEPAENQGTL